MSTDIFFQKIRFYSNLSEEAEIAWTEILREKEYNKGDFFISVG